MPYRCSAPSPPCGRAAHAALRPVRRRQPSRLGLERTKALLAAQAGAALRAIDLSAELGRRADRLLAIAPKLRAKGADFVVDPLLNDDALVASRGDKKAGMSDRGLRRLFDRLADLGACA